MNTFVVALTLVAVLGLGTANIFKYEQNEIEDETDLVLNLLSKSVIPERFKPASFFKKWGSSRSKVTAFKWTDCGGTEEHFKNLYVSPDPLILPGNIMVAASAIFNAKLDSPLQTNLTIEKKVGSTYVKIPCIDNFGSCVYDDLCEILEGATCPEILHRNGINCTCPFPARTYLLSLSKFDARSFYFPSGDYHARGELGMNGNFMGCLDVYLSIAQNW